MALAPPLVTPISQMLGIDYPVLQAPMSWVARSRLASAVCNAGGLGIIETGSCELDQIEAEVRRMADLTDRPYAVNLPLSLLRGNNDLGSFVEDLRNAGVAILTTSAGDPRPVMPKLKGLGFTVLHVVGTKAAAIRAEDAGADAVIVEGSEGGGFKQPGGASTIVLLPLVAEAVSVPVVVAGGIIDGATLAAALCLGASGVQLGTAMLASTESPVHENWKRAIVDANETDTVLLNPWQKPSMRVLRNDRSWRLLNGEAVSMGEYATARQMYFDGDMAACVASSGQVVGRIDRIRPVSEIVQDMVAGAAEVLSRAIALTQAADQRSS